MTVKYYIDKYRKEVDKLSGSTRIDFLGLRLTFSGSFISVLGKTPDFKEVKSLFNLGETESSLHSSNADLQYILKLSRVDFVNKIIDSRETLYPNSLPTRNEIIQTNAILNSGVFPDRLINLNVSEKLLVFKHFLNSILDDFETEQVNIFKFNNKVISVI